MNSATSNNILDRAIDSEEAQHHDFLRLVIFVSLVSLCRCSNYFLIIFDLFPKQFQEHIEGYHELSAKTKIFFSTAVAKWDADFYVKVDDDVHVNLGISFGSSFLLLLIDLSALFLSHVLYRNNFIFRVDCSICNLLYHLQVFWLQL